MPFQPGNTEARKAVKAKRYREALNLELAASGDNMAEIRKIARAHIALAASGDMAAIREFADRIEGKVAQAIVGDDEHPPVGIIVTGVVRPDDSENDPA
jgi:hypothetical protein